MTDPAETLLDDLARFQLREFFRSLRPHDVVVGDAAIVPGLGRIRTPDAKWRLVTVDDALREELPECRRQFVCTLADEGLHVERLRRHRPGAQTFGLLRDVLPRRAAGRPPDHSPEAPLRGYVVLCVPRSGSYHLCGLLQNLGFGRPDEHLDSGVCAVARRGGLDLHQYLETLTGVAVDHGWFATKLISHVLFEAFESGYSPNAFVDWLQRHRFRAIYLHRSDKAAQAVSNYFARSTGVWHVVGDMPAVERPPYDYAAIRSDWDHLHQQERWLKMLLDLLPGFRRVDYEELDARPADVLAALIEDLTGVRPDGETLDLRPRTRRQRDARSGEFARRFSAERRAEAADGT